MQYCKMSLNAKLCSTNDKIHTMPLNPIVAMESCSIPHPTWPVSPNRWIEVNGQPCRVRVILTKRNTVRSYGKAKCQNLSTLHKLTVTDSGISPLSPFHNPWGKIGLTISKMLSHRPLSKWQPMVIWFLIIFLGWSSDCVCQISAL